MSNEIVAVGRSADGIAMEIRVIVRQTQQMMCSAVVEIGRRLIEAQELVPHGEWANYITNSCGFSQRSAENYMQLARRAGDSQTFANLPYTKALALLALPEGTTDEFIADHPVEDISVRELKRQISEYKEQLAAKDEQIDAMGRENTGLRAEISSEIAQAETPITIPEDLADRLRAEGAAAANSAHAKTEEALSNDVRRLTSEIRDRASEAEKAAAEKDAIIEDLRRQLAAAGNAATPSDGEVAKAEALAVISELQAAANKLHGYYLKFQGKNPKLAKAIQSIAEKLVASIRTNFGLEE